MDWSQQIFATLIFLLPAYLANMAAALAIYIPGFKKLATTPINEKYLGSHKTVGGFLFGTTTGTVVAFFIYKGFNINLLFLHCFLCSFGALFGDSLKSFFKRLLKIAPGQPFIPFDQIDLVIGALFFTSFIAPIPGYIILWGLLITPILHLSINIVAYKLKLKKVWW